MTLETLLSAILVVESGGKPNTPDGDGGRSIGPYQIMRAYWEDSGVPGRYEQCRNRAYARRVVLAYWRRYEPRALAHGDWESLARCHNAGPNWRKKIKATDGYWRKVQAEIRRYRRALPGPE